MDQSQNSYSVHLTLEAQNPKYMSISTYTARKLTGIHYPVKTINNDLQFITLVSDYNTRWTIIVMKNKALKRFKEPGIKKGKGTKGKNREIKTLQKLCSYLTCYFTKYWGQLFTISYFVKDIKVKIVKRFSNCWKVTSWSQHFNLNC